MTDEQKKCSYNRNMIAEVYQCSQNDAELIKYLRIFSSQNIDEIESLIKIDEEVKVSDFIHKHLDELKHIFHVCSEDDRTEKIEITSTMELVPVVHGEWIIASDEHDFAKWDQCSICGYKLNSIGESRSKKMKYCPGCGAKMVKLSNK